MTDNHFLRPDNGDDEMSEQDFLEGIAEGKAQSAVELEVHRRRLRELILLMEGDIAFGSITAGETRKLVLADARKLIPDLPPAVKTLADLINAKIGGADVEEKPSTS